MVPHASGEARLPYMVAVARLGRESECRKDIRALGFRCWHPIERVTVVQRGRKTHVDRLLLGQYLFVEQDHVADWKRLHSIKDCEGVLMRTFRRTTQLGYVIEGTEPAIATDQEVQRFRALEDRDGFIRDAQVKMQFEPGEITRVIMGALVGFRATYVQETRTGNDLAEVEIFGRKTRIEFAPGALEAA